MGAQEAELAVETFVFDLDGTLVDSGLDIALSANFVRLHFDLPELPVATAQSYVGDGVVKLLERALGHGGRPVTPAELSVAMGVFQDHYGTHLLDHTRLYPGVMDVLQALSSLPLQVATNKPRDFTDRILAGVGLEGVFRRIVGGDETPARKPDPVHLELALEGLEVEPGRVVMVGDSPNDVNAARAFGAISVGCTFGLVAPAIVAAAQPDYLIDTMSALTDLFGI